MRFVLTPDWFIGNDVLIEVFSFIILLAFCFLAYKSYKLNRKNRSLFYLSSGFGLVALAQLAGILTRLVLYYNIGPSQAIGQAIITNHILSSVSIFYYAGFFFQRFFMLLGLYMIYRLPRENKSVGDYLLVAYFILMSAILGNEFYYLFNIAALFILVMISENYYRIYMKNKFVNTKILLFAFGILALSQLVFIFSKVPVVFVAASLIELIGYAILLILIVRILKYGKKTKPHGDNLGYAGDDSIKKRKH